MVFTIDTSNFTSSYKKVIKSKIKINALQRLRYFPIRVSEKLLDKYLKENYNMYKIFDLHNDYFLKIANKNCLSTEYL